MTDEPKRRHPAVEAYIRESTSRAGKAGAAAVNALLTPAKRRRAAKKAVQTLKDERGEEWLKERAKKAAAALWKKKKGEADG